MDAEILTAIDQSLTPALAATLSGLSLTAATFLMNLGNSVNTEISQLEDDRRRLLGSDTPTGVDRTWRLDDIQKQLDRLVALRKSGRGAVKRLIWAFTAFVLFLLQRIWVDPPIEERLSITSGVSADQISEGTLGELRMIEIDLGTAATPFMVGLLLLAWAARIIYKFAGRND